MSQVNLYLPDDLAKKVRKLAQKRRKSVSAWLAELIRKEIPQHQWHADFFSEVVGGWEGDVPEIERTLPEEREAL